MSQKSRGGKEKGKEQKVLRWEEVYTSDGKEKEPDFRKGSPI